MSETIKPRGRPAMGPKSGKGAVLTTRITAETRAALEAEAERTGRSISQVTEIWLEEARQGRARFEDLVGGVGLAATIERLVAIDRIVREKVSDTEFARTATIEAWANALPWIFPQPAASPQLMDLALMAGALTDACKAVIAVLEASPDADPVKVRAAQPVVIASERGLLGVSLIEAGPTIISVLNPEVEFYPSILTGDALTALKNAGSTAHEEIDQALECWKAYDQQRSAVAAAERDAKVIGRAVVISVLNIPTKPAGAQ